MNDATAAGGGRDVRRDGVQLVCPCYIEVRNWLNAYFAARAYSREAAGEEISAGEKKGAGLALANMICWIATLCDEDLERIQLDGANVRARLDALSPLYGKTAGRVDPITIVRRAASVFASVEPEAAVGEPLAADDVHVAGIVVHPPGHHPKGMNPPARKPDGAPRGRR